MPPQFQSSTLSGSTHAMGLVLDNISKLNLRSFINQVSKLNLLTLWSLGSKYNELSAQVSKLWTSFGNLCLLFNSNYFVSLKEYT